MAIQSIITSFFYYTIVPISTLKAVNAATNLFILKILKIKGFDPSREVKNLIPSAVVSGAALWVLNKMSPRHQLFLGNFLPGWLLTCWIGFYGFYKSGQPKPPMNPPARATNQDLIEFWKQLSFQIGLKFDDNSPDLERNDLSFSFDEWINNHQSSLNRVKSITLCAKTIPTQISKINFLKEFILKNPPHNYSVPTLKEIPPQISELEKLKILNLSDTAIESIPEHLVWPKTLIELRLRCTNQLTSLPNSFCFHLTNLQILELRYCNIQKFPSNFGNLSQLKTLNLKFSEWKQIPVEISQLPQLEVLDLECSKISLIPETLNLPSTLKTLNLGYTQLPSLPDSILRLPKSCTIQITCSKITSQTQASLLEKITKIRWETPDLGPHLENKN